MTPHGDISRDRISWTGGARRSAETFRVVGRLIPALLLATFAALGPAAGPALAGSIFARDGVGEWIEGYDLAAEGRGGTAIGVRDPYNAFGPNPAAAAVGTNAAGHVGLTLATLWSTDGQEEVRRGSSTFTGMGFYLPLGGRLGLRAMMRPVTDGVYVFEELIDTGSGSAGNIRREEGSRGLLQYGGDLIWHPSPLVSLSAGLGIISGSLLEETTYSFADSGWSGSTVRNELRVESALFLSGGLLLQPAEGFTLGAFVHTPTRADARAKYRAPGEADWQRDHEIEFPLGVGAGAGLRLGSRLRLCSDLIWRDWENTTIDGQPLPQPGVAEARSTLRWGVGIERTVLTERLIGAWRRLALRAGFAWAPWYLRDGSGDAIDEWRLSGGVGIPIQIDRGMVDVTFVWGQRGDQATNGISEKYYRLGMSFTFARVMREY